MLSGGPIQVHIVPIVAAGIPPINTVTAAPKGKTGPPTCGIGEGTAGVCIGHKCISPTLAAGCDIIYFLVSSMKYQDKRL
jgi:hypothetical protein